MDSIREGVTHMLDIKVSRPASRVAGDEIRQALHGVISNCDFQQPINGVAVTICWKPVTTKIGRYDAFIPMFTDVVVDAHVRRLLTQLVYQLQTGNPERFNANTTVDFMITKPLAMTPQAISPRFVQPLVIEG